MTDLLPRPSGATTVRCPNCGHGADLHAAPGIKPGLADGGCTSDWPLVQGCSCEWTPNDIAWWWVYGELTPPPW
jgi:hypothetical protein